MYCLKTIRWNCRSLFREEERKPMKAAELIKRYESIADSIRKEMSEYKKHGSDKYYNHELRLIERFIEDLKRITE